MTNSESGFGNSETDADGLEARKHLVFRLANELFAAPLVSIREIIKMQPIKPVPFMVRHFKGILNLRGQIVSVIDLRLKFDIGTSSSESGLLVVVDSPSGPIGAIVDDVVSVSDFQREEIEKDIAIKTKIPVEFFIGVGRLGDRLVNIIDIGATLSGEDFAIVRRVKESQSLGLSA